MDTAIVVFTRDLRLHDNPALHQACARARQVERECVRHRIGLTLTPGLTVVPPAELKPAGGGHYRVFTPYWRAWRATPWRSPCPPPSGSGWAIRARWWSWPDLSYKEMQDQSGCRRASNTQV